MDSITPDFLNVQTHCSKPNCTDTRVQRHHVRHEKLFLTEWSGTEKQHTKFYKALKKHYNAFRPRDLVLVCSNHHAEIHWEYREIINEHSVFNRLPLPYFSVRQAVALMRELKFWCYDWLEHETPGMDPDLVFGGRK